MNDVLSALRLIAGRYRRRSRLLHLGDALALVAIVNLCAGPTPFDQRLLERIADGFSVLAPQYATRENAAMILAVLEAGGVVVVNDGIVTLTHRGMQMRLMLAKGEPTLGLTAAFEKKRHGFSLTIAA